MSIRTPTRTLFIATLAVASIAAAPTPNPVHAAPGPAVDPSPATTEPSDEPRRVIIDLAVDTDLEITLDGWHEITDQRTRIHTAQNTIATLITDHGGQITHRYTLSPTLGALLTPDAHTAIATHPLVTQTGGRPLRCCRRVSRPARGATDRLRTSSDQEPPPWHLKRTPPIGTAP